MYNASGWGGLLSPGSMTNPDRNWGANPQKNQWIAGVTGYGGDFGGGGFQNWGPSNGYDIGTLERLYSQHQGRPSLQGSVQPPTMGYGQSNWSQMPGLQGLLGGLTNYTTPVGGYAASQPGFAGVFPAMNNGMPTANSGSTMLWTV